MGLAKREVSGKANEWHDIVAAEIGKGAIDMIKSDSTRWGYSDTIPKGGGDKWYNDIGSDIVEINWHDIGCSDTVPVFSYLLLIDSAP